MNKAKRLFNIILHNWRIKHGRERYQVVAKLFDKESFIKKIDEKIKNQQDRTLRVELPLVRWQEFDKEFYDKVYDGYLPSSNILDKHWMRIGEFVELVENRGTKLVDYDPGKKVGTFEIIKNVSVNNIKNEKIFIAPLSGSKFVFEQDSDNVLIVDKNETRIVIPREDFIAFLNYVMAG